MPPEENTDPKPSKSLLFHKEIEMLRARARREQEERMKFPTLWEHLGL